MEKNKDTSERILSFLLMLVGGFVGVLALGAVVITILVSLGIAPEI